MVTKKKSTGEKEEKKGRVKVGKLKLNRETVTDLTGGEQKKIKGGARGDLLSKLETCTHYTACCSGGVC